MHKKNIIFQIIYNKNNIFFINIFIMENKKNLSLLQKLNYSNFINKQLKSFSFIIFVITVFLIYTKSKYNIIPLNIIVFLGSIVLYHIFPNYYKISKEKKKIFLPLIFSDIILHYIPIIYIIYNKLYDKTVTNYLLCFIILILYFIISKVDIFDIYFDYNQYFDS